MSATAYRPAGNFLKKERAIKIKRSQPAAAPTLKCDPPVGAAEGCDLLILKLQTQKRHPKVPFLFSTA
jgi:hypothetical protein